MEQNKLILICATLILVILMLCVTFVLAQQHEVNVSNMSNITDGNTKSSVSDDAVSDSNYGNEEIETIDSTPGETVIARDTVVDGCRMMAATNGKVVAAGMMGKLKTVLQMITVALVLLNNLPFELLGIPVSTFMLWFAAFVSFASGVQYFNQMKEDILESK